VKTVEPLGKYRKVAPGAHPEYWHESYISSAKRSPRQPLISIPQGLSEITGPVFAPETGSIAAFDLTRQNSAEPLGERIIVSGRVLDEDGHAQRSMLVEIWQANASGRYLHSKDQHNAPLDPNFTGCGHAFTDEEGRYRFVTIRPGAYPWQNHANAWRPAHIHFSLFGPAFGARLVTQMYFPGDPLLAFDPIYNCVAEEERKKRLISQFDWDNTIPQQALGYRFDIVLRGRNATPMESE
jgi:protocatechuate 3,4-dioxygenase, beta subunit